MKVRHIALSLSVVAASALVLVAYAQKGGVFSPSGTNNGKPPEDDAQIIRARETWFYRQRAYPLPRIPAGARERAWQQFLAAKQQRDSFLQQKFGADYAKPAAAAALAAGVATTTNPWSAVGPKPTYNLFFAPYVSGRVNALVVDPCDSTGHTVFLGGAQGGVWLTTNGGTNWAPFTDQAPSLSIGSITVPPASAGCTASHSNTIYVGTGEENFAYDSQYGAGVLVCNYTGAATPYSCARPANQTFVNPQSGQSNYVMGSEPLTYDSGGPFIGGLAIGPVDASTGHRIILAAVQGYQSVLPSGVWCSQDGGTTWNHEYPPPGILGDVATGVAFDSSGYGYAAIGYVNGGSLNGVYKTSAAITSCTSPAPTFSNLGSLVNAAGGNQTAMGRISISVYSGSTAASDEIAAAIANASDGSNTLLGVFTSTNGGSSWTVGTGTEVASGAGFCQQQCFYDIPIAIDPRNPKVIYAGGSAPDSGGNSIIASTDGGTTWTDVANNTCNSSTNCSLNGPHVDTHAFAFTPTGDSNDLLYVGNDGGMWSTTNPESPTASQTWTNLNSTLALTQVYPGISTNPYGWTYRSFLGAQDNGAQVFGQQSVSGLPLAWDDTISCGDGAMTAVDPLLPSTVYSECAYIPGLIGGVSESLQNGNANNSPSTAYTSFFSASNGINLSDNGSFITPLAIDPEATGSTGDAQTLYFGTYRVYQTRNGAGSWSIISPDLSGDSSSDSGLSTYCTANAGTCVLTSIGVAPKNSNEVATGSSVGDLYMTTNATQGTGATWTEIGNPSSNVANSTSSTPYLPQTGITSVAVDSTGNLYATYSGFSGTYSVSGSSVTIPPGHVFYGLVTPGTTPTVVWNDVSSGVSCASPAGNLPNIPVNDVVVDPDVAGQIFVGTDVGVYVGELQGTAPAYTGGCWQPLGTGLPNSQVLSLSLNEASRTLLAGTHGRSVWAYPLGAATTASIPVVTSISPATAPAGNALSMTLTGKGFSSISTVSLQTGADIFVCPSVTGTNSGGTQLTASLTAACLQYGGVFYTTVTNSAPGGGSSNPNLVAAASTYGVACTGMSPPGCLLTVTGTTPTNANFSTPTSVKGSSFSVTEDTSGSSSTAPGPSLLDLSGACGDLPVGQTFASNSSGFAPPPNNGTAKAVWFSYTPSSNVTAEFDTIGSTYDTILSVWKGSSINSLTSVICNDDISSGVNLVSQVSNVPLTAGTTYYIMVSTFGVPILDGSGNLTQFLADGGKLVFNSSISAVSNVAFNAKASTPNPSSVSPGSSSSVTLTLTPQSGSSGTVNLQPCTNSVNESTITCTYSSSTVTLSNSSVPVTVTINTVSNGALPPGPLGAPPIGWLAVLIAAAAIGIFLLMRRSAARRARAGAAGGFSPVPLRASILAALGFALLAGMLIFQSACGGGGSSAPPTPTGTPAGNYTITIPTSPAAANGNQSVTLTVL